MKYDGKTDRATGLWSLRYTVFLPSLYLFICAVCINTAHAGDINPGKVDTNDIDALFEIDPSVLGKGIYKKVKLERLNEVFHAPLANGQIMFTRAEMQALIPKKQLEDLANHIGKLGSVESVQSASNAQGVKSGRLARQIQDTFNKYDKNDDGELEFFEMRTFFIEENTHLKKEEKWHMERNQTLWAQATLLAIFELDEDLDGSVSLGEYGTAMQMREEHVYGKDFAKDYEIVRADGTKVLASEDEFLALKVRENFKEAMGEQGKPLVDENGNPMRVQEKEGNGTMSELKTKDPNVYKFLQQAAHALDILKAHNHYPKDTKILRTRSSKRQTKPTKSPEQYLFIEMTLSEPHKRHRAKQNQIVWTESYVEVVILRSPKFANGMRLSSAWKLEGADGRRTSELKFVHSPTLSEDSRDGIISMVAAIICIGVGAGLIWKAWSMD